MSGACEEASRTATAEDHRAFTGRSFRAMLNATGTACSGLNREAPSKAGSQKLQLYRRVLTVSKWHPALQVYSHLGACEIPS